MVLLPRGWAVLQVKDVLVKLGTAIYLHKEQIKQAEKAKDAVDYLAGLGILGSQEDKGTA